MGILDEKYTTNAAGYAVEEGEQINIPPEREGGLWKVIASALRCPNCNSSKTKAQTGKRLNGQGLSEHYRYCVDCRIRFRVILE